MMHCVLQALQATCVMNIQCTVRFPGRITPVSRTITPVRARARNDVTDLNAQSIRPSTLHQFKHQAYNFGLNVNGNKILTQPTGKFRNQNKFLKSSPRFPTDEISESKMCLPFAIPHCHDQVELAPGSFVKLGVFSKW